MKVETRRLLAKWFFSVLFIMVVTTFVLFVTGYT